MLRVAGLRSVNWNALDAKAAERFYTEVLGATVRNHVQIGGAEVAHLQLGDTTIGLFDASAGPRPGVPHHTLRMEWPGDIEVASAELKAAGATVEGSRAHGSGPGFSLYLQDPIGNRLELSWDPPATS